MSNENTSSEPKKAGRKLRVFGTGVTLLMAIAIVAHITWLYSGSNQWEKAIDKNGIQIYTLKAPGSLVKRVKGVTHVRTSMNAAVSAMMSDSIEDCKKVFPGCTVAQTLANPTPQDRVYLIRIRAFRPFAPREFLLKGRTLQDPRTKAVTISFTAAPDELPQNACCHRVTHMANSWQFTPLDNGQVEIENRVNMDIGLPYFMFNRFIAGGQYKMLSKMQAYVDAKNGAKWAGIEERTYTSASLVP